MHLNYSLPSFSGVTSQNNSTISNPSGNVVVFAKDQNQFNSLLAYNPSQIYPNLLAVRIDNLIDASPLHNSGFVIYPAHLYMKAKLVDTFPKVVSNQVDDNLGILGIRNLWDQGYNGTGVVVGVLDNGVDFTHPDLAGTEFISKNFTIDGASVPYTHGTIVAGAIVSAGATSSSGNATGTAIGAKIAAANLGQTQEGFLVGDFLAAFDWLANITNLRVINTSWSGGGEDIWYPIVERLEKLNIIVVGSAGNEGSGIYNVLGAPGNTIGGISVGAITYGLAIADFSSEGPIGGGFTKPDILAPGQGVLTTLKGGGYGRVSGTSLSSPLAAGAIASLVSGLNAEGIQWNVGEVKAAIMHTAYNPGNYSELVGGQGILNVTASLELIQSRNVDSWIPQVTYATPRTGFFDQLTKLRQDVTSEIPFTLISSNASRITISLEGNISDILTVSTINQTRGSQPVSLYVNTMGKYMGNYSGSIMINDSVDLINLPITIPVKAAPKYRVLFDIYHTSTELGYTNYRAGYRTGSFIDLMNDKGVWVDIVNAPFTEQLLFLYDLVWMPDPFDLNLHDSLSISQSEVDALQYYLSQGGRLFLHYFGLFTDPYALDGQVTVGNNPTYLNQILSLVSMSMSEETPDITNFYLSQDNSQKELVYNDTILGKNPQGISMYSANPILFNSPARTATFSNQIVTYSPITSGRVLISSTDAWFGSGDANNDPSSGDYQFMTHVIDWLFADQRIEFSEAEIANGQATLNFQLQSNGTNVSPTATRISNKYFLRETYNITQTSSNNYTFTIPYNVDGQYDIEISAGKDYYRWVSTKDSLAPVIIPLTQKTQYDSHQDFTIEFNITDNLDTLSKKNINITLDGQDYFDRYYVSPVLGIFINSTVVHSGNHELNITVSDSSGNISSALFKFRINGNLSSYLIPAIIVSVILLVGIGVGAKLYLDRRKPVG